MRATGAGGNRTRFGIVDFGFRIDERNAIEFINRLSAISDYSARKA